MGALELAFGVVLTVLAGLAAILALLMVCFWLLGTLRQMIARGRPRPRLERPAALSGQEQRT